MRNIKMIIEYDGTNYSGWQEQINAITVQQEIERATSEATQEKVKLIGASRTDKGVHAKGQVANFFTNSNIPDFKFKDAINIKLPEDIVILNSEEVEKDFHSRFDAVGKRYKYIIYNSKTRSPLLRNYSYYVPWKLDYKAMKNASKYFVGTHDFYSFMVSRSSAKVTIKSTVRTINKLAIEKEKDLVYFLIEGNAFLYNMVRIIIGTLIDVGKGKIEEYDIPNIIKAKDRTKAGHTAPAQGLYLEKIFYE